jgi:hypothetical protein
LAKLLKIADPDKDLFHSLPSIRNVLRIRIQCTDRFHKTAYCFFGAYSALGSCFPWALRMTS